jgi:hypothetical protein
MIRLDVKELGTSSHGNTAAPELAMDKKELLEALDTAQGIIKYSAFIASGSRQDARRVLTFSLRNEHGNTTAIPLEQLSCRAQSG